MAEFGAVEIFAGAVAFPVEIKEHHVDQNDQFLYARVRFGGLSQWECDVDNNARCATTGREVVAFRC